MKLLLQLFIYLFTCFTSSAIFSATKIVVPTNTSIFQKAETITYSEKVKIGIENFARSSIEEHSFQNFTFNQTTFSLSTYLEAENSCVLDIQKTISPDKIAEDFQGNTYQKAYMAGKYTTAILSVLLPTTAITKGNFIQSISNKTSKLMDFPKASARFVRKVKDKSIAGLKIIRQNGIQLVFTSALNLQVNLASFTDEGLIIANSSRFISSITADYEVIENIGECALQIGENGVSEIATLLVVRKNGEYYLGKVVNGAGKFTSQQIDDYVALATKQGDQSKVMLGLFDEGSSTGYISKAGNNHTYFDMGSTNWNHAMASVGNDLDEMWKINKKFIDNQKTLNKVFWFSHNPFSPQNGQFFAREVNYLIDLGVEDFEKVGELWKAVW